MGVIVKFKCQECDFVADNVLVGPGFISCQEAVFCRSCGHVSSSPLDENGAIKEEYSHCSNCGSGDLVIWDRVCPKCGSTPLNEETEGLWD